MQVTAEAPGVNTVLDGFRRAAAGEPAGLADARAAWGAVPGHLRPPLGALGRLLASDAPPAGLHAVLQALVAGDTPGARSAVAALPLAAAEHAGAVVAALAPVPASAPAPAADGVTPEALLARMGVPGFRPGQREAVQAALDGRDALVVMPTGGGKSLCYQLPALAGRGLTVVVSPLIALITDQHRRLLDAGHPSVMLASTAGEDENGRALDDVRSGRAAVVFCAPERFSSGAFRAALATRTVSLFVVDEAHCVSEWGHDFRPDYLRLAPVVAALGRPPVMAATATATPAVAEEIVRRLGLRDPVLVRTGVDRPNLTFDVVALSGAGAVARKRALLAGGLADPAMRPAIVYCGTRADTERVAEFLSGRDLAVATYHAGMDHEARARGQRAFMEGDADVIVATNAFGQGIDKRDIRSVWHWALPTSVEAYYQEAGRAGRDGLPSRAVLLAMRGDLGRLVQFIRDSELGVADVERALARVVRGGQGGTVDVRAQDDRERIALAVAERTGALELSPAPGGRLAVRVVAPLQRAAVARACRDALDRRWGAYRALKDFVEDEGTCRRRRLLAHFGTGETPAPTVRCCDVCDPPELPVATSAARGAGPAPASSGPPVDERALTELKRWRAGRADGKPAYTVATNAVLEEVLRRRPRSAEELLAIRGVGPSFVERHGDDLLALLPELA